MRSVIQKWLNDNSGYIAVLERPTNVIIKYSVQITPHMAEAAPIEISLDSNGHVYFSISKYILADPIEDFQGKYEEYTNKEAYVLDVLKNVSLGNLECYELAYKNKIIGYGGALHLDNYDDCIYECIPSFSGWMLVKASLAKKKLKMFRPYHKSMDINGFIYEPLNSKGSDTIDY